MTPAAKIAKARRLLIEATQEIRAKEKADRAADRCTCGHRRDEHTVSCSVNYTEGFCMTCPERGGCRWFHYDK